MTTPFTQIQLRNGTFQEWYDANPILALGEPGFEINTGRFKIGDGAKRWNDLDYMSCCPKTSPTPTPTAPGANTIFISWEDCYGGGSIDQIPNKFGHFDLCGLPCPISKDVRFYFQNNLEELHKRTKDLTPYNENYNYTCDTVDGNDTIVIRVEKGTGLKLELNNLAECTKPKPICNCSCCPVTPTPVPEIPECLSYGGIKIVLSACHGCNRANYNLYVGGLTENVWDDSQEVLIEEINLNSSAGPNVVTESPYPCGTDPCCVSNCGGILSVQEVIIPSETIAELPLIPSETNCITIPVKLKCLLSNCHSNVTQYLAFSEGGCCVGSGTLDSQVDTGSGVGVQTITVCCGACATPTPTPTVTDDNIWGGTGCIPGVVYDISTDKKYRLYTEEELSTLTPADNISVKQFNIPARDWAAGFPGSPSLQEWFQINFTGNLEVVTSGEYNIRVLSDDGAKLWIDGVLIIDNDGVHNPESKNQNVNLSSGIHSIRLDYFQGPKWKIALVVYWTPPGGSEVVIPISSFVCGSTPTNTPTPTATPTPTPTAATSFCSSVRDANGGLDPLGYVVTDPNDGFNFGTGDFTMECWVHPTKRGSIWTGFLSLMQNDPPVLNTLTNKGVVMGSCQGSLALTFGINTTFASSFNGNCSNIQLSLNSWQHIALTRESGSCRLFINGVQVGTTKIDNSNVDSNLRVLGIGKYYSDRVYDWGYNGFIDEVRISNISRYNSNFTPSSNSFDPDENTVFLCHFENANEITPGVLNFQDSSQNNIGITGRCQASLSSEEKKFGNYSLKLGLVNSTPPATPTPTINNCNLSSWSWWTGSHGGGSGQKIQGLSSGAVRSSSGPVDGILNTFWLRSSSGLKGVDFATPLTANGTSNYGGTHPPEGNNIPFQIGEVVEVSGFNNVVDGNGAVAITNGSYYVSDTNVDNFDLVFSCAPSTPTPTPTAPTPTPTPASAGAGCWRGITASNDSSSLAAVTNTNKIYTSNDGGFNWIEREIPSTITYDITSSDDGTKLALLDRGGKIYISSDGGVSWTARESNRLWVSIASSGDGAKLIAIVQDGQIYTSDNSGVSWTARENNRNWVSVSSSSDGVKLVAADGDYTNSQIYTSSDSGASWTARVSGWWKSVTGTADGVKLAAITRSGDVYVSINSGVDWTQKSSVYGNPRFIKYSGDGSKIIVGTFGLGLNNGQIYTSINNGESWSLKLDQVGGLDKAASSYDGSILSICECSGYIRISSDGGLTWGVR